jgi:hypothetical protein
MIQSSGPRVAGATGLAMGSHHVVTNVTSQRWYTSRMIAAEGTRHENLIVTEGERNQVPAIRIVIAEDQAHRAPRRRAPARRRRQDMEVVGQASNGARGRRVWRGLLSARMWC